MDKPTFFAQALATLGDREYKSNTPPGRACDLWFPTIMYEALNFGSWSFATRSVSLAPGCDTYPLPDDCLRPLKIVGAANYRIEGRDLIIERRTADIVTIRYISDMLARAERLPDTQPLFVRGCTLMLAARIAPVIACSPQLAVNLEQMAQAALSDALHQDVITQHSNDQHPLDDIVGSSIL